MPFCPSGFGGLQDTWRDREVNGYTWTFLGEDEGAVYCFIARKRKEIEMIGNFSHEREITYKKKYQARFPLKLLLSFLFLFSFEY